MSCREKQPEEQRRFYKTIDAFHFLPSESTAAGAAILPRRLKTVLFTEGVYVLTYLCVADAPCFLPPYSLSLACAQEFGDSAFWLQTTDPNEQE
jgi:hypothetical protein